MYKFTFVRNFFYCKGKVFFFNSVNIKENKNIYKQFNLNILFEYLICKFISYEK